jgi:hypothetical protein
MSDEMTRKKTNSSKKRNCEDIHVLLVANGKEVRTDKDEGGC